MKKKQAVKPVVATKPVVAPEKQSERVMLALTPDELKKLQQKAAEMSASLGIPVGVATVARSLLLASLRAEAK